MWPFNHLNLISTFNLQLTCAVSLICFSQFNYGFDNYGFSGIQSLDEFTRSFGDYNAKTGQYAISTQFRSIFNSVPFVGQGVGILAGSMISKHFGRRWCVFSMSLVGITGGAILTSSESRAQVLVGRIINNMYSGMELSVVPIFQAEIVPKSSRGLIVGTYQLLLSLGGLVMASICYSTQHMQTERSWRIPFAMFLVVPSIIASCVWFIPESPRWLVMKGRHEEARKSMFRLRQGKFTEEQINEELDAITGGIEGEHEKGTFPEMWKGLNLKRTMIVMGIWFFQHATGQNFAGVYGGIFLKSIGAVNQFEMAMIQSSITSTLILIAILFVDKIGRRMIIFIGGSIQAASLMVMGALGTIADPSYAVKLGIVAQFFIFVAGFSTSWAISCINVGVEVPNMRLRDLTWRAGTFQSIVIQVTWTAFIPYALASIGSKIAFFFGALSWLGLVFAYFFVPNLSGRTLEEVDKLFEMDIPVRKFHKVTLELESALVAEHRLGETKQGAEDTTVERVEGSAV